MFITLSFCLNSATAREYKLKLVKPIWTSTQNIKLTQANKKQVHLINFDRFTRRGDKKFKVGSLTYTKYEKDGKTDYKKSVQQFMKRLAKENSFSWSEKKINNKTKIYSAVWAKQNKYLRVFLHDTKDHYSISIATFRLIYSVPAIFEADIIQRKWAGNISFSSYSQKTSWLQKLIPEAYADTQDIIDTVRDEGGAFFDGVRENTEQITNSIGQGADAATSIARSADEGVSHIGSLARSADSIDQNLEQFLSLENFFYTGAVTALGAGVGSFAFNLAKNATISGLKSLYFAAIGNLPAEKKVQIVKETEAAFNRMEQIQNDVIKLEMQTDANLAAMAYLLGDTGENIGSNISLLKIMQEIRSLEQAKEDLIRGKHSFSNAKADKCLILFNQRIQLLQQVETILNQVEPDQALDQICRGVKKDLDDWSKYELELAGIKNKLIEGIPSLVELYEQTISPTSNNKISDRKQKNFCLTTAEKNLKAEQKKKRGCTNDCAQIEANIRGYNDDIAFCKTTAEKAKNYNHLEAARTTNYEYYRRVRSQLYNFREKISCNYGKGQKSLGLCTEKDYISDFDQMTLRHRSRLIYANKFCKLDDMIFGQTKELQQRLKGNRDDPGRRGSSALSLNIPSNEPRTTQTASSPAPSKRKSSSNYSSQTVGPHNILGAHYKPKPLYTKKSRGSGFGISKFFSGTFKFFGNIFSSAFSFLK